MTALASGGAVLVVSVLAWLLQAPALAAPPLGVTAYMCFRDPRGPASAPRSILVGHALGILSGLVALWACGAAGLPPAIPGPLTLPHALAAGLAIALTVASTEALRCPHPPAGATTLVVSLGLLREGPDLLALLLGALVVVVASKALRRACGLPGLSGIREESPARPGGH